MPLAVASSKGVEEAWDQVAATIHASAADTARFTRPRHRPWISDETLDAVDLKAAARLAKNEGEWQRLCSEVRA